MKKLTLYGAAVVSGAFLALAFPPYSYWGLGWIALAPLLIAVRRASDTREAANLGAVAGLVFYGFTMRWLVSVFGVVAGAFWCIFALQLALFCVLMKLLRDHLQDREGASLIWTAAAGVVWVGIEYFRSEVWWLECSWLALGYSQGGSAAAFQSVRLWGVYGLSGILAAASAALSLLSERKRIPTELGVGFAAMILFLGARRVEEVAVERGREITVALVQSERFDMNAMADLSVTRDARNADLVVWPEYGFNVRPQQRDQFRRLLHQKLEGSRAVAVLGAAEFPEEKGDSMSNYAWVIGPDGRELGRYDKAHPIPYIEQALPANPDPRPVQTPLGPLGIQICYDLDFEDGARRMARMGAGMLVVPNMDPSDWGEAQHKIHSAMAPFRAVESGLWIARSASSGISQIIDPVGRVRASLPYGVEGVLVGKAYVNKGGTPYTRGGWVVAPGCTLGTGLLILWLGGISYPTRRLIPSRSPEASVFGSNFY